MKTIGEKLLLVNAVLLACVLIIMAIATIQLFTIKKYTRYSGCDCRFPDLGKIERYLEDIKKEIVPPYIPSEYRLNKPFP